MSLTITSFAGIFRAIFAVGFGRFGRSEGFLLVFEVSEALVSGMVSLVMEPRVFDAG